MAYLGSIATTWFLYGTGGKESFAVGTRRLRANHEGERTNRIVALGVPFITVARA